MESAHALHIGLLQTNDIYLQLCIIPLLTYLNHVRCHVATCGQNQQDLELYYIILLWPQNPRSFCRMQIHPDHYLFVLSISLVGVTADRRNLRKGGERRKERRRRRKKKDLAQKMGKSNETLLLFW